MDDRKRVVASGYDAIADDFLAWSASIDDHARERLLDDFAARLPAGSSVLDLGCGAGLLSTRSLGARFDVTGVDLSAGQIDRARRNVPDATFVEGDMTMVDFDDAAFDGVSAFYAIPHVPREEHAALFRRIAGWLRVDGLLLATLGARDSADWMGAWLGTTMFFSSFDAAENRRLLEGAGFELMIAEVIDTIEPDGPVPFLWILARRRRDGERPGPSGP